MMLSMSRSYLNYIPDRTGLQRVMNVPGIISEFDGTDDSENLESDTVSSMNQGKRVIVSNQLPLIASRDEENKRWCFDWDKDALVFQLKDGFAPGVEVIYVGRLEVHVDTVEQVEVARLLLDKFNCGAVFLSVDLMNKFDHGFCKHYLWPLFHYMSPVTCSFGFDRSMWRAYIEVNRIFADKVREVTDFEEDYVWVHDYHLMILPSYLRKRFYTTKLGFFLHSPFPSSEIYRSLPVRKEILKALLNCDLVGFHTCHYAHHFLSCCSIMLGVDYQSKLGYIVLEYFGRTVSIKICHAGIHMGQLESVMSLPYTASKIEELNDQFNGKMVMLGVDDIDIIKGGISTKFLAMGRLLDEHPEYRGKVVLIQIMNPARRSCGTDEDDIQVQHEIETVACEINLKFGNSDYKPIVCINKDPVSTMDKVAYYAISECVVVNPVRDGMNLVPYKYTVSRQGTDPRKSVIIVSEFIGCCASLSGAIRVNPWDIESVANGMNTALSIPNKQKEMRHEKHYKYIASHDVAYWARSLDQDLERACKDHYLKSYFGLGFGFNYRVVALDLTFRKLTVEHIVSAYNKCSSRLILLDYDGTVMPHQYGHSVDNIPYNSVLSILNGLCRDPNNVVFIVSGRGKDSLSNWFSPCERLGLSAEHGGFTRWTKDSPWESCISGLDLEWKEFALTLMKHYMECTDGSSIEEKESGLVWHHQDVDPALDAWQAEELLDHLKYFLANDPVMVKRGQHIVEVKAQGLSKGKVVENLISTMSSRGQTPDFVLCIGDDRSDEDMFESIAKFVSKRFLPDTAEVFACNVGQTPSCATYYLDDTTEVIKMLAAILQSKPAEN